SSELWCSKNRSPGPRAYRGFQPARGGVYLGRIHWLCQLTSSRSSCSKREEAPATPGGKTEASGMARNPSRPDHSFSAAKPPHLAKRRSPGRCTGLPPTSPADGGKPPDYVIGWSQKLIWRSGGSKKAEARRASPVKLNTIKIEADNQEGVMTGQ